MNASVLEGISTQGYLFAYLSLPTLVFAVQKVGIDWDGEVTRLRGAQDWDAALRDLLAESSVEVPDYFTRPFHAYSDGNLCWDAAFEQRLASMSVG